MRFWDSSAAVPILVEEPRSAACRTLLRADSAVTVWALTRTEITSALCRLRRESRLVEGDLRRALARLDRFAERWSEVEAVLLVRENAERLLRVHPLRAADALQLGAALCAVDHRPRRRGFVSLDENLLEAAEREGFDPIHPGA